MRFGSARLPRVLVLLLSCSVAWAANDGQPDPDLLIDGLATHSTLDAARQACRGGEVVWADRFSGYYFKNYEAKFGSTPDGSYACEADAHKAHYWSTDPRASMDGHPGRTFPFDPIYYGS